MSRGLNFNYIVFNLVPFKYNSNVLQKKKKKIKTLLTKH